MKKVQLSEWQVRDRHGYTICGNEMSDSLKRCAVILLGRSRPAGEEADGATGSGTDAGNKNHSVCQRGRGKAGSLWNLPVPHCIRGTEGWQIRPELDELRRTDAVDKDTFGSVDLGEQLLSMNEEEEIGSITLVGLCTDICVISNALLVKAFLPEVPIFVDAACCAGVTVQSHENALNAMEVCQIRVINRTEAG